MLRRADNVSIHFVPDRWSHYGEIHIAVGAARTVTGWCHRDEFSRAARVHEHRPQFVIRWSERTYWQFRGRFYWDNDELSDRQVHALIATRQDRERARVRRAEQIYTADARLAGSVRPRRSISDDVRHLVFTRDRGRCQHCGSQTELQFDHIIPHSMGGGSGPENLQLLCGPCNRRKSAGLSVGS